MSVDTGFFGPDSEVWRVLRERSVVLGGMRALLMHGAHPLVAAAAEATGMYERQMMRRHERTLQLTFTLIFGSRSEASTAAAHINSAHRLVRGTDARTGLAYYAKDPELMLWVHASLISSFLLFESLTVGRLDGAGRQRFHEDAGRMAGMLGLPGRIPRRTEDLDDWISATIDGSILSLSPNSQLLYGVMRGKAAGEDGYRSRAPGYLALHTLPPALRDLYGIKHDRSDDRKLAVLARAIRIARPVVPPRARFIGPAICAYARLQGKEASVPGAAVLPRRWRAESGA